MSQHGLPVLYTLLIWWFSTVLILYLDGLPKRTYRWSLLGATCVLMGALYGLSASRADLSLTGAYLSFTCGVLTWGWVEMSFLMGLLTGPRRTPCPVGCGEWRRAGYAIQAILYHELALIIAAAAVVAVTWGGPNQTGTWTFMILWVMRQSAKLNVFLGVRNLYEAFLPENLRYLQSYFTRKPMNLLFPLSVTVSTIAAAFLWHGALTTNVGAFETAALTFLGTLLTLAVLEHWLLVLPLPVEALWRWGMRSHAASNPPPNLQRSSGLTTLLVVTKE